MDIKGTFLGLRRYSFQDQNTGNTIQGGKLILAVPSDSPDAVGYSISEIGYPYDIHSSLAQSAKDLALKLVSVTCDVSLTGRRTKVTAKSVRLA